MDRKTLPVRLDPALHKGLAELSKILNQSMNQLANEALARFVRERSRAVEQDLEATLDRLRAYSEQDPDFEQAIEAIVDAEARHEDPAEGSPANLVSPAQEEIRQLLGDG